MKTKSMSDGMNSAAFGKLMKIMRGLTELPLSIFFFASIILHPFDILALFPEPPNELFGIIELDGSVITDMDKNVVVEARRVPNGAPIARYVMGSIPNPNHFYSLRLKLETVAPINDPEASTVGTVLYITVIKDNAVRDQLPYTMGPAGTVRRLDFGTVDSDNDSLPDGWEQLYFMNTSGSPGEDPDRDGWTNRQEYQYGTNPTRADARHPADINPPDYRITISELADYYMAWKAGRAWSIAPTNIPQAYVTRASFIWESGEYYRFDAAYQYPTNFDGSPQWWANAEPTWWVSAPAPKTMLAASSESVAKTSINNKEVNSNFSIESVPSKTKSSNPVVSNTIPLKIVSIAPAEFRPGQPFIVTNQTRLVGTLQTYTVEDFPPSGWAVVSISHGGSYDAINHKVKWGPFFDKQPRDLYYQVIPPANLYGKITFNGRASYDGYYVEFENNKQTVYIPAPTVAYTRSGISLGWSVAGVPGGRYRLEVSTDLKEWQTLSEIVAGADGKINVQCQNWQITPMQFFRAILLESK